MLNLPVDRKNIRFSQDFYMGNLALVFLYRLSWLLVLFHRCFFIRIGEISVLSEIV